MIQFDLKTKKLDKYSYRYHHNRKPLLIGIGVLFIAAATTSAAVVTSRYLLSPERGGGFKPEPVTPTEVGLNVTNADDTKFKVELTEKTSIKAQDFKSEITLKTPPLNPNENYYLPETLDEVTIDGNKITNYIYKYNEEGTSANFSISGIFVTGKINITLTVATKKPIQKLDIVASEDCSGVIIPDGQTVDWGTTGGFKVKIDTEIVGKGVLIEKIKVNNDDLLNEEGFYFQPSDDNVYQISFADAETVGPITTNITITAKAIDPIKYRHLTVESKTLCFYNQEREQIAGSLTFKPDVNFVTYIGTKLQTSPYNLPLKLNITGTTNNEQRSLVLGKDYQYRFIDDKFAELTIFPGSSDILIGESQNDTSTASFIYHVDANSPSTSITFEFKNADSHSFIKINWGDDTDTDIVDGNQNQTYSISHTYETSEVERDYLISFGEYSGQALPNEFGFNVYDDQVGINSQHRFSPNEKIAPYCSGISNITAVKMNGENWEGFIGEGLIHTNIESLYIPKSMQMDGRYLSYCDNLSYFYLGEGSSYKVSEDRKMLLEDRGQPVPTSYSVVAILGESSEEGVVLDIFNDLPITTIEPYACVGRSTITSLTLGKDIDEYLYGAIIDCPNLNEINVDDANETYITNEDVSGNSVNMVAKQKDDKYEIETLLLAIKNTLPDGEEFTAPIDNIEAFAFSGTNIPEEFIMDESIRLSTGTLFNPYSFYRATNLLYLEVGNLFLPPGNNWCNPIFYGCSNLENLSIYQGIDMKAAECPTMGIIQECPKLHIEIEEQANNNRICVYNNAIYYTESPGGASDNYATLIGTCSDSQIVNSFVINNLVFYVNKFVNSVFNGNELNEIYIPSKYDDYDYSTHPFIGCDGAVFICNSEHGFAETIADEA